MFKVKGILLLIRHFISFLTNDYYSSVFWLSIKKLLKDVIHHILPYREDSTGPLNIGYYKFPGRMRRKKVETWLSSLATLQWY